MENNFSLISDKINTFFRDKKLCSGSNIPTSGEYKVGDFIVSDTQTDGVFGWVCVVEGNPGTWETLYLNGGSGSSEEVDLSDYVTKDKLGELNELETDSKESIVSAVNEVKTSILDLQAKIDISNSALAEINNTYKSLLIKEEV